MSYEQTDARRPLSEPLRKVPPARPAAGRPGEHAPLTFTFENVFDKNYHAMGSGTDAPGMNAVVNIERTF